MVLTAYYLDNPSVKVTQQQLDNLGVVHWNLDATKWENDPELEKICKDRGYSYRDFVNSTKMPDLKNKLDTFLIEHLHEDEEIRYFIEGSGYFDVRDGTDKSEPWLRIHGKAGDMIVLPAGIYHRFIPDDKLFFHVMRFFSGAPVWTPFNRKDAGTDEKAARKKYVDAFLSTGAKKAESKGEDAKAEVKKGTKRTFEDVTPKSDGSCCGGGGCGAKAQTEAAGCCGGGACGKAKAADKGDCCKDGKTKEETKGEGCCEGGACSAKKLKT